MIQLCRELMYFSKDQDEVVFYEGDIGKKFFIIIDGEVDVLEEKVAYGDNQEEVTKLRAEITQKKHLNPSEVFDEFENSKKINTLITGDSFGEIALRHKVPRTSSVRCAKDTHFAILSYESYNKIIRMYHDYLTRREIRSLYDYSLLATAEIEDLEKLFKYMKKQTYTKGHIVYKEGEAP